MNPRYFFGAVFILLGITALFGIDFSRFIGPMFLIFIGWSIVTGSKSRGRGRGFSSETIETPSLNEVFVFTGAERKIDSDKFTGGKVVSVFGGADIDISAVKPSEKEIRMEVVSVFGGLRLRIPATMRVQSEAVSIVGGIDNHTGKSSKYTHTLRITGAAIFGGVEITN